jgi:hypothetical protein
MYLCKHCGKFSKALKKNESQQAICAKCGVSTGTPVVPGQFASPLTQQTGDDNLPPGFGAMIEFTPTTGSTYRGSMVLKYPGQIDIPGTPYCHVLPRQPEVKRTIVDEKETLLLNGQLKAVIGVAKTSKLLGLTDDVNPNYGRLVIAEDGHHTFVAALRAGLPVTLMLYADTRSYPFKDWTECKYVNEFGDTNG